MHTHTRIVQICACTCGGGSAFHTLAEKQHAQLTTRVRVMRRRNCAHAPRMHSKTIYMLVQVINGLLLHYPIVPPDTKKLQVYVLLCAIFWDNIHVQ